MSGDIRDNSIESFCLLAVQSPALSAPFHGRVHLSLGRNLSSLTSRRISIRRLYSRSSIHGSISPIQNSIHKAGASSSTRHAQPLQLIILFPPLLFSPSTIQSVEPPPPKTRSETTDILSPNNSAPRHHSFGFLLGDHLRNRLPLNEFSTHASGGPYPSVSVKRTFIVRFKAGNRTKTIIRLPSFAFVFVTHSVPPLSAP